MYSKTETSFTALTQHRNAFNSLKGKAVWKKVHPTPDGNFTSVCVCVVFRSFSRANFKTKTAQINCAHATTVTVVFIYQYQLAARNEWWINLLINSICTIVPVLLDLIHYSRRPRRKRLTFDVWNPRTDAVTMVHFNFSSSSDANTDWSYDRLHPYKHTDTFPRFARSQS